VVMHCHRRVDLAGAAACLIAVLGTSIVAHGASGDGGLDSNGEVASANGFTTFTDPAEFLLAVPGQPLTVDLDGLSAGTLVPGGSSLGIITFNYDPIDLTGFVTDTFDSTSSPHGLGAEGLDHAFLDGDTIGLGFAAPVYAIGLSLVASDPLEASELRLVSPLGEASSASAPYETKPDGGLVYFVGLVASSSFGSASVEFANDGERNFVFSVDDVTTSVPEPTMVSGLLAGLTLLVALQRHRSRRIAG
jgi:hypothetical protein